MLAETKAGWYWFCEQNLKDGTPCKASAFKIPTKSEALQSYGNHVQRVKHQE